MKMVATPNKVKKEIQVVTFQPETADGQIEFEFDVNDSGKYKISAVLVDNIYGGKYQPFIDENPAGIELDMVSTGGDWTEYVFGLFKLEKGKHIFTLKGKGDSPKMRPSLPKKYSIGISSLILLRIEDL